MLNQMPFKPGDYISNVLSENLHYLYPFKRTINSSKILHLDIQVSLNDNTLIVQSYKKAKSKEFTYLPFDFRQNTTEKIRLR